MRRILSAGLALITLSVLAGSAAADGQTCQSLVNLKQAAERTGVLKEMAAATKLAGLDDNEIDIGPLTLLAPTDAAFKALPEGFRKRLLAPENREHLTRLLMHHALLGEYDTERLRKARVNNYTVPAVDASEVEVFTSRGILFEDAKIVEGDIRATDGIIHLIDRVLIPPSVMEALWDDSEVVEHDQVAEFSDFDE